MKPRHRAAFYTVLWGAALGALILGVGGRVAMRLIAEATGGITAFSIGGSLTVLFLGAVSGAIGGMLLVGARALLRRWPPATTITFWLLLLAIALRGLHPVDRLRLLLFLPLVAMFGVLLQWRTWRYRLPARPHFSAGTSPPGAR